jgi:multiple sugar transport system substrate-binding protein
VAAAVAVGVLVAAGDGCAADGGADDGLTFWTPHVTPDRLARQEATAARFTEATGIAVEVVPMAAADQNQALVTGAVSGDVPDVVLIGPDQAAAWSAQGLLDTGVAADLLAELGPETFSARAVEMVTVDGVPAAVPSDGWGQVLVYRTDLLAAAGVAPPTTTAEAADAAERLDVGGVAGIALGTRPGDPFTTQTLEALLLAGGCELVDAAGEVALDSPACVRALADYQRLAAASVEGEQDVETTRAAYLAGDAAMLFWGSHVFDELAGLAPDFPPTCAPCAADPRFLAANSGFTTALGGPGGGPGAQYGLTLNLGVPRGADADGARRFAAFLLGEGYLESLGVSPEGRVPMRAGTPEDPDAFAAGWAELPSGEDPANRVPLAEVYGADAVDRIVAGAQDFRRWGYGTDDAALAGALAAQHALAREVAPLFDGADPAEVAARLAEAAEDVRADLR